MVIKYMVIPGSDGTRQLSAQRLIELYGIRQQECVVASSDWGPGDPGTESLEYLYPRADGHYVARGVAYKAIGTRLLHLQSFTADKLEKNAGMTADEVRTLNLLVVGLADAFLEGQNGS